ncbi:hypothetical protein K7472_30255 [Streptomyces sp. PTM05]|uniref:Uncharacterized protein n=1 Tax=Streptantibioticus parmotrematis TaxID=2873249 RepID=A0ABS7R2B6_9ACTN|nr:hypothetical protein [Streptantibioticus parmotrematis]MBY8889096.1 hypothetical protein [Streptantibioticus parmotrematis]
MPQPSPSPPANTTTTPPPTDLSLEERMAFTTVAMTMRLDEAAVAYEVNTAHLATPPVVLADVVTAPLPHPPALLPAPYRTPVAALLQRAHQRLLTGGWCTGALVDDQGAVCLLGAIRTEAGGDAGLERDAVSVLLDAIRRHCGAVDSVPSFNDAFSSSRVPVRMVDQAACLADARGL